MSEEFKLLIIIEPSHKHLITLERALETPDVKGRKRILHIFIGVDANATDLSASNPNIYRDGQWLKSITDKVEAEGLDYTFEISWSKEWQEAVLQSAERFQPDHIFIPDHNSIFSKGQWALMRKSRWPITIARPQPVASQKIFLAAVNILAEDNPKYAELNEKVITDGMRIAKIYGADFHVVNAYPDSMNYPDREKLLKRTQLPTQNVHVEQGDPTEVISSYAKKIGADTLLIGTLARTGAKAFIKGNTVEKVLKKMDQDIIIYSC